MGLSLLEERPGYGRRIRMALGSDRVRCVLEDGCRCMSVLVRHDAGVARPVELEKHRMPNIIASGCSIYLFGVVACSHPNTFHYHTF